MQVKEVSWLPGEKCLQSFLDFLIRCLIPVSSKSPRVLGSIIVILLISTREMLGSVLDIYSSIQYWSSRHPLASSHWWIFTKGWPRLNANAPQTSFPILSGGVLSDFQCYLTPDGDSSSKDSLVELNPFSVGESSRFALWLGLKSSRKQIHYDW